MRRMGVGIVFLACAVCVPALFSQDNYKVVNGPEKFYYGHVSLVEILNDGKDPVVLRTGADQPIPAVLNLPLGPGDTLRTSDARRLEIQFDNATIVRLDLNTELKIETILARSLSRRETSMTNLVLERGRICVMYKEYDHTELFQVLTPNAAVKLRHNSVATITAGADGASDIQVDFGRATAMFGPDEKELYQAVASRNERLVIDQSGQATTGGLAPDPDFASWNAAINKDFEALHEGKSSLPKPLIRGVTKATFYFAQTFGDRYGEWLYDDLYGYVWRPYYNDYYPGGTWRPYYYGRWVGMAGQMFWIPSEPWGWIPYHLGVWQWDAKRGWFWLPGSAFAPAWVDWAFFNGTYFAWIPWSFYDWMYDGGGWGYFGSYGGYYPVGGYPYFVGTYEEASVRKGVNVVSRNQLKKPSGSSVLPMPKEFKRVLRAVENAVKRGDSRVIDSLRAGLQPTLLARDTTINPPKVPDRGGLGTTTLARPSWRVSRALEGMIAPAAPLKTRGVDWNPDVRIGQRLGVNIRYSSRTNEIVCPELRLSSAMMGRGVLAAERPRSSGGSVVASGGSMSTGSGGGSTSAGSSGASSSSSGGGGGHIR